PARQGRIKRWFSWPHKPHEQKKKTPKLYPSNPALSTLAKADSVGASHACEQGSHFGAESFTGMARSHEELTGHCSGQVFPDTRIGDFYAAWHSYWLGDTYPSVECRRPWL